MLFGRVSRKIILAHPKTISSIFSCQTRPELQMGLASMVRWNKKMSFLAANTQDRFSEHREKKYPSLIHCTPCVQWIILLYFWCCESIFLLEVLDILFRHMASWILSNTNIYKINKWLTLLEILLWAMIGSSNYTIIQTQTSKTTQKWVTEHKTMLLLWPFQSSDLNPVEDEWGELKRRSCESEGSGVILDEGMVSDLLSGVLQPHQVL